MVADLELEGALLVDQLRAALDEASERCVQAATRWALHEAADEAFAVEVAEFHEGASRTRSSDT